MKIEIDFTNSLSLKGQLRAVERYMFDNITSETGGFDTQLNFNHTFKGTGNKVNVYGRKTKGGTYKFKTWQAI